MFFCRQGSILTTNFHKQNSLRTNMAWSLAGQVVYNIAQWLMIVMLTKLSGVESVGVFILAFSVCAPVIMFSNMRLNVLLMSESKPANGFFCYLYAQIIVSLFAFFVILIINIIFYSKQDVFLVVLYIATAKSFESISGICLGYMQKCSKSFYITLSQILKAVFSLFGFAATLFYSQNLALACFVLAIMWLLVLVLFDFKVIARLHLPNEKSMDYLAIFITYIKNISNLKQVIALLRMSLSLGIVAGLNSFNTNISRYFVSHALGFFALGCYSPASYIYNLSLVAMGILISPAIPLFSKYYFENDKHKFYHLLMKLITFSIGIGILGLLCISYFGQLILSQLFGKQYGASTDVLFYLMLAACFNYIAIIFIYVLTSIRALRIQVLFYLIGTIIIFSTIHFFIKKYQLLGVALSVLLESIWLMLSFGVAVFYFLRKKWHEDLGKGSYLQSTYLKIP